MAIAGVQNTPVLDSTLLRDSQPQASRSLVDGGRVHTPTSSLLQMWRGLEDEHVVSQTHERVSESLLRQRDDGLITDLSRANTIENGSEHGCFYENSGTSLGDNASETWSEGQNGSQNGEEDSSNLSCDFGESERERVRQIFREWMSNGVKDCMSDVSRLRNGSRSQWLGENDQDRVRLLREGVQKNIRQSSSSNNNREDQVVETGRHFENVRDGLVINQTEGRIEHARRGIRRLCGRQALIDMLKKAERERQGEIQGLLEQQAVSCFAHRNRIQSLLKSRFLRNGISVENDRPITVTESELGLLRRRQTVSDLREGFVSRLDNSAGHQVSGDHMETSSTSEVDHSITVQNQGSNFEIQDDLREQSLPINMESHDEESNFAEVSDYRFGLEGNAVENILESASEVDEFEERNSPNEVRYWHSRDNASELIGSPDNAAQNVDRTLENIIASDTEHEISQTESQQRTNTLQTESHQHTNTRDVLFNEQYEPSTEEVIVRGLSNSEGSMPDGNSQQSSTQVERFEEHPLGNEPSDQQHLVVGYYERSNSEEIGRNQPENVVSGSQDLVGDDYGEDTNLQNEDEAWNENDNFQAAVPNWLEGASNQEAVPAGRVEPLYFSDDDNGYRTEIRELLSRRSVSNLLSSGFRESLDQLIQSYVERQGHAANDWELDGGTSPQPTLTAQDLDRQVGDQNVGQGDNVGSSPHTLPSPPAPSRHPFWDQSLHDDNWSRHDMHPRMGIDWEIMNDMRIDMARLQQRMSNLQMMLDACMDMQLELQRSIRQEVSAALNRSAASQGISEHISAVDVSKWDNVRKGVCCICYNSNINSLLYRCGHMCTCSKCAAELVEMGGKCPMCRAPVVEVIRAYSQ